MKSEKSKELVEKIMHGLDHDMGFFTRTISPEYFGVQFLHDKELYQKDIRDKLRAYLNHIIYGILLEAEQ